MTSDLNLNNASIQCDTVSGKVLVDENDATNIEGVYAIGDVAMVSFDVLLVCSPVSYMVYLYGS